MGYVSGEDGFTLIFKYDTKKKSNLFLFFDEVIGSAEENKKTGKFLQLQSRGSNKDGQTCG